MQNSNPNNQWSGRSIEPQAEKKRYHPTPYPHTQLRALQMQEQNNGGSTILSPVQGQQLALNVLTPNPHFISLQESQEIIQMNQSLMQTPQPTNTFVQPQSGKGTPSHQGMLQFNQQQPQVQMPQMYNPNLDQQSQQYYFQPQQQSQTISQTFNPLQQQQQQNYLQNTNPNMFSSQQLQQTYPYSQGQQTNFPPQTPTNFMNQQVQMTSSQQLQQAQYPQNMFGSQQFQQQVQQQGPSPIQQYFPQTTQDLSQIKFPNQFMVNPNQGQGQGQAQGLQQLQFNIKPKYLQGEYNEEQDADYVPQEEEEEGQEDEEEYIEESNHQDMQEEEEFDDQNFDLEEYKKWRANN